MQILKQLINTVQQYYVFLTAFRFVFREVEILPEKLSDDEIYIVKDGIEADSIVFKCPCGCRADIHLNLLPDASPRWRYFIKKKKINISPSVWRKTGCQSHFWVKKGRVLWCSE